MKQIYIIPFCSNNNNWNPDAKLNLNFLNFQRKEMMRKLRYRGKLYLNDALELLGTPDCYIPNDDYARMSGWLYDEKKTNDYEFFTISYDTEDSSGTIWLKFEVDGIIFFI